MVCESELCTKKSKFERCAPERVARASEAAREASNIFRLTPLDIIGRKEQQHGYPI